ncbi:MAG: phospholipid/cholesterol/gamma-HCH transport system substrate-binding protein [Thermoleophilaceae bacterium]|jgi:virulence factor Mce-like protein|nr:phospholipid/cholesterol/gamma-HCH transport system substrate-binding protein [Thermoleophilaceae bacterium]
MPKETPSVGRILSMVVFSLTCFGLLLFLWLSFGGPIPLKPKAYELKVPVPEATTLAEEADVRIAGVTVGKVKSKELDKGASRTTVTLSIDRKFAPLPKDTRMILRQKTLLGETYVELTPGTGSGPKLHDGDTLPAGHVEPTVELDEILRIFSPSTRAAFRNWVRESAMSIKGRGQDLNFALANLAGFAQDGAGVLQVLDNQKVALQRVVKNTGVVFAALNRRNGQLRSLITNSERTFSATSAQQDNLARIFEIFPTFLSESKLTLARLEQFSLNTHPLVNDLKPVADDLGPTVQDLSTLGPDLENLFRHLDPNIKAAPKNLPQAVRFLRGARPLFGALHGFLPELNPVLSYANFSQDQVAHFFVNGGAATQYRLPDVASAPGVPRYMLGFTGAINEKSLSFQQQRPNYERGNSYVAPNNYRRAVKFGIPESFDCLPDHPNGNGTTPGSVGRRDAVDTPAGPSGPAVELAPCFVQPPFLWDGKQYPRLERGKAPLVKAPFGFEGKTPARVP